MFTYKIHVETRRALDLETFWTTSQPIINYHTDENVRESQMDDLFDRYPVPLNYNVQDVALDHQYEDDVNSAFAKAASGSPSSASAGEGSKYSFVRTHKPAVAATRIGGKRKKGVVGNAQKFNGL